MKKSYSELKTLINKLGYENPEVVKYAHDLASFIVANTFSFASIVLMI